MNLPIETLRGLACVLLVAYHVIGADPERGLQIADGWVRWLNDGLAYVRMPLFTFLSGLVYGLRPFSGNSRAFLTAKARRLLVPMLVVGTLFALLQSLVPGTNASITDWKLLHLQPVAHFWFVEALFWVFLAVWALEHWPPIKTLPGFALVLAVACGVYLTVRGWSWLGIEGALYLMPYFLVGLAMSRFSLRQHLVRPWVRAALLLIGLGLVLSMGVPTPNPDRRTVAILLTGIALCLLCLSLGLQWRWLSAIGRYSYSIYLFHVFFAAAIRIAAHRLGVHLTALDFILGLLFGLLGPILLERQLVAHRWPALLLLGRTQRRKASATEPLHRLTTAH
ncbi:MAG: acyltransferase [Rhodoferax sp.]|nr:acyltransferase [Rhodoferax sp.]